MHARRLLRLTFVLIATVSLLPLGCGGPPPEGNLPPERPATPEELKQAAEETKENMRNLGKGAPK